VELSYSHKTDWLKWILFVLVKLLIYGPVIIFGPVAVLGYMLGFDFAQITKGDTHQTGCAILCTVSLFAMPDLLFSLLVPWKGGGSDLPTFWEDVPPFARR
jgi:hypothetical protein